MSARRTGAVHRHRADLPAGGKVATRTSLPGTVLVLNASFEPMHRVSLKHAISMLVREVAVVHEAVGEASFGPFPVPRVLRLVRYVAMAWRYRRGSLGPVCSKGGRQGARQGLRVLRRPGRDGRPRPAALARWRVGLAEPGGRVRALQPPQGRPDAGGGRDEAARHAVRPAHHPGRLRPGHGRRLTRPCHTGEGGSGPRGAFVRLHPLQGCPVPHRSFTMTRARRPRSTTTPGRSYRPEMLGRGCSTTSTTTLAARPEWQTD